MASAPGDHVEVLRPVEAGVRRGHGIEELATDGHEMNRIVLAEQELGRVLRLEERVHVAELARLVIQLDEVLVAVEHVDLAVCVDGLGVLEEEVGVDVVVMVEEAAEVARGRLDATVGVLGDAVVLIERHHAHPCVSPAERVCCSAELVDFRTRVHEDEFEIVIGLGEDGIGHDGEVAEGRAEERDHNREARVDGKPRRPVSLFRELGRAPAMALEPCGIGRGSPGIHRELVLGRDGRDQLSPHEAVGSSCQVDWAVHPLRPSLGSPD